MNSKQISKRLIAISLFDDLNAKRVSAAYELRKTPYTVKSKNSQDRITENYEAKIELYDALLETLAREISTLEATNN